MVARLHDMIYSSSVNCICRGSLAADCQGQRRKRGGLVHDGLGRRQSSNRSGLYTQIPLSKGTSAAPNGRKTPAKDLDRGFGRAIFLGRGKRQRFRDGFVEIEKPPAAVCTAGGRDLSQWREGQRPIFYSDLRAEFRHRLQHRNDRGERSSERLAGSLGAALERQIRY